MLALVIALLSFAVGSPTATSDLPTAVDWTAAPADGPCCETAADPSPEPCPPGEPCAPGGGCCACVSCAKRVADTPTAALERRATDTPTERVAPPTSTGIDGEEAVWHPPRG